MLLAVMVVGDVAGGNGGGCAAKGAWAAVVRMEADTCVGGMGEWWGQ
jgi:hypothetical protein